MLKFRAISAALACMLLAPGAFADATLTFRYYEGEGPTALQIRDRQVYAALPDGQRLIWDTARSRVLMVNDSRKEFMSINRQTLERANSLMDQVSEQMKSLPAAQRDALARTLGIELTAGGAAPVVKLTDQGTTRSVIGKDCRLYQIRENSLVRGEACIATTAAAGISDADQATLQAAFALSREFAGSAPRLGLPDSVAMVSTLPAIKGVPMALILNQQRLAASVSAISNSATAAVFSLPAGYREVDPLSLVTR